MDVEILEEKEETTGYVTIDGVVHDCRWLSYGYVGAVLVLVCSDKIAPSGTRGTAFPEPITCVACLGHRRR